MAKKSKFLVTGIRAIDKRLKKLEAKDSKKVIRKVLREEAKGIQQDAKANAPTGDSKDTKRNVKVKAGKRSNKSISINVQVVYDKFEDYYPSLVEYGVAGRGGESDQNSGWLRGVFDRSKKPVTKNLEKKIVKGLDDAVKKLNKR